MIFPALIFIYAACSPAQRLSGDSSSYSDSDMPDSSGLADSSDSTAIDSGTPDTASSEDSCDEVPAGAVSLPEDDAPHGTPWEWWYWTGHLQDGDGRWYGFEQVFFIIEFNGYTGLMVHHAITDIDASDFSYEAVVGLYDDPGISTGFSFELGDYSAQGGDGHDSLHGQMDRSTLDLSLQATKAPVFQHGDGYLEYDFGGYTYYYSRERMAAQGSLDIQGDYREVSGTAWFDHQWGELDAATTVGWDWFAIQLDDGREYMIYLIHSQGGNDLLGASLSDQDCVVTELDPSQVEVTSTGQWKSPHSGCTWPMGWDLVLEDEEYTVTPVMEDQELYQAGMAYWEGASTVTGSAEGRAYVELNGYCGTFPGSLLSP